MGDANPSPSVTLDREPVDKFEQALVAGFPQNVEALEAIWVRQVPPQLNGGMACLRVYLAMRVLDQQNRHAADRVQYDYEIRFHHDEMEFEFHHIPADRIPADLPSRIWRRPSRLVGPDGRPLH